MKLSELKKQIKDNIYEILSEEPVIENFGPAVQSTDPTAREIEDKINKDPKIVTKIAQIMAQAEKGGDTTKLLGQMTGLFESDDEDKVVAKGEGIEITKAQMDKLHAGQTVKLPNGSTLTFIKEEDEDREPTKAELEKEKVKGAPSKFKVPTDQFEDFKLKLKTLVGKIKDMEKGEAKDKKMAALKQFIKKPELIKAFKERDVKIDTGGLVG